MTNVLPPERQRDVWGTYRARFIFAGSAFGLALALLAYLSLLPSYLALRADERAVPPSGPGPGSSRDQADITRAQGLLAALKPAVDATTTPSEVLQSAIAHRPRGILVDHITYASPGTIVVSGVAQSRESISEYKKALLADPRFKSVSVPVGDLVGAEGGRFSITLSGNY